MAGRNPTWHSNGNSHQHARLPANSNGQYRAYMAMVPGGNMQGAASKFEVRESGTGCLVLTCNGGLSWEDRELLATSVEQCLNHHQRFVGVVLDMAAVTFVNSAGLGALFQLLQRVRGRGGRIIFANLPPALARLFRTVGLDRLAETTDGVNSALELLATPDPAADSPPTQPADAPDDEARAAGH